MKRTKLPEEIAWCGEHASEIAIVAIADAQADVIPKALLAHVAECAECSHSIAKAADLSVVTQEMLAALPRSASVRFRVPWRALLLAALVATLGAVPALLDAGTGQSSAFVSCARSLPVLTKGITHLFRGDARPLWLTLVSAGLLLVAGFALARALPSPASRRAES